MTDTNTFEAGLHRDGYEVQHDARIEAGRRTTPHSHPFDVRALVLQGEVTLAVAETGTTYRVGDSFDVAADTEHSEVIGPDGVTYLIGRRHRA